MLTRHAAFSKFNTLLIAVAGLFLASGCACEPDGASNSKRFDHMEKSDLSINDHVIRAWVAKTDNDRQAGFMFVEPEQLEALPDGAQPGMVFLFPSPRPKGDGFWMRNVPVNLDIAFIDSHGTIVTIETMAAYDWSSTYSKAPYWYALEVRGGLLGELGISEGDTVHIPDSILNNVE